MHNSPAIIMIIIILVIAVIVGAVFLIKGLNDDKSPVDTGTSDTVDDRPAPDPIKPIEGNTVLSEEREVLLEKNIISLIDQTTAKSPVVGEDGNYVTDKEGNLVYEDVEMIDYTNVKENLTVIVNAFADAGYPDEVIRYVQRFYFMYFTELNEYESNVLIEKLMNCFSKTGNTTDTVYDKALNIFGFERADKFAFVFEEMMPAGETTVLFFDVKPTFNVEWTDELENSCIYSIWHTEESDEQYERNLEAYLHTIVSYLSDIEVSEFDIRLAQLLYCSYIADVEYTPDWLDTIIAIFDGGTPEYDSLRDALLSKFGFDIYSNQLISSYYDGITEFNTEVN